MDFDTGRRELDALSDEEEGTLIGTHLSSIILLILLTQQLLTKSQPLLPAKSGLLSCRFLSGFSLGMVFWRTRFGERVKVFVSLVVSLIILNANDVARIYPLLFATNFGSKLSSKRVEAAEQNGVKIFLIY